MAGYKGQLGFHRPVAMGGMNVGVAEARCLDLHDNFSYPWLWNGDVFNLQRGPEIMDNSSFHVFLFLLMCAG